MDIAQREKGEKMLNLFLYLCGATILTIAIAGAAVAVTVAIDTIKSIVEDWR